MNDSDKNVLSIIENSLQAITIATGVFPKIILTNKALEKTFGYTDKELKGFSKQQLTNLIYPADRKRFFGNYKARLAGKKIESVYNTRIFSKKGEIRSVKISSQRIIFNGEPVIKTNYLDVTEKNQLSEKISIIESILPAVSSGLLVIDNNNKVTLFNDSFLKMWKIPRSVVAKKDDRKLLKFVLKQLISPEEFLSRVRYLYAHPKESSVDTIKFKDGRIVERYSNPQIENGKIVGRVWSFNDVTVLNKQFLVQKELMEKLVKEKAKSDALIQAIGDGVMVINKHSKITYINDAGQKMLGWPLKDIIGNDCAHICSHHSGIRPNTPKDKCPTVLARELHKNITKTLKDNYLYMRADGSYFPVYISTSPLYVDGKDDGGILIFRDISEEKDIDRMKSDFISLSSHQLRTPITGINWLTEALLEKGVENLSPDQRKMIEDIHTSNQHMISLVNLLLTVARLDMGTFPVEPIMLDIENICKLTIKELENEIEEKNIKIETACLYRLEKYKADPRIMDIIFQNLLSNAIKYTKNNSTVAIKGRLVKDELIISFTDSGIGIPKEQQSKIFTRLFRAENAQAADTGGVGLGLYITKAVVETVGGRIWFKSKLNVGTTFFVALPSKGMKAKKGPNSKMS